MTESLQNILILDATIFAVVVFFYFYKSPEINFMIGYRTKRSMQNQRNWEYAQKNFFHKWLLVIPVMLFTQIPVFFGYDSERILELSFFEFLIISGYAIIDTERNLKKMDSDH